jgi:hypothetical protein
MHVEDNQSNAAYGHYLCELLLAPKTRRDQLSRWLDQVDGGLYSMLLECRARNPQYHELILVYRGQFETHQAV